VRDAEDARARDRRARHHGRQCAALYPEKPIFDIPGYPRIEAAD